MAEIGSHARLFGSTQSNVTDASGQLVTYPTASYKIDGVPSKSPPVALPDKTLTQPYIIVDFQVPSVAPDGEVIYFEVRSVLDGTHTVDVTVTAANDTNQWGIDYFLVVPIAGGPSSVVGASNSVPPSTSGSAPSSTSTSSGLPTATTRATPVGAIVGGVVGGIAILAIALWYFLGKRSGGFWTYPFEKPSQANVLASEGLYAFYRLCYRGR
jgi:hypothetical protein